MLYLSFIINIFFFSIIFYLLCSKKYNILFAKNIFLKTQLDSYKQTIGNKKIKTSIFQKITLTLLFKYLNYPKHLCYIIKPETILKWYRNIIKKFWTYPFTKHSTGRPPITPETIQLILKFKHENHNWGCRRIHGELKKNDIFVAKSKIAEILIQHGLDPTDYGLTWSKFLKSHIKSLFAMDFKTVTSIFGKTFYVLFFIFHSNRKIIHFNITQHPTKKWIEQQLRNFIFDFDKKIYLIHDNDQLFKYINFKMFNIEDVSIAFQTPNMNAIAERFIGSFDHEALDNFVILTLNQLYNITNEYVYYYNNFRPHQGMGNVTIPDLENVKELKIFHKSQKGEILKQKFLGGLINHYYYKKSA